MEPLEKRDHVVKELVDTEKNYVEVLSKLKRNFMLKLANTFPPESQSVIFHNIPVRSLLFFFFYELRTCVKIKHDGFFPVHQYVRV